MKSVLQDWVMELPLREQGTLLTVVRGCDLAPKHPLDSLERQLTAAFRGAILVAHDPREIDYGPGCFMLSEPPVKLFKLNKLEHYPLHFVSHVIHAAEVIARRHPNDGKRVKWLMIYMSAVKSLHLNIEREEQMFERLSEDRISNNNVIQ